MFHPPPTDAAPSLPPAGATGSPGRAAEAYARELHGRDLQRLRMSTGLCISGTLLFFVADLVVAPARWPALLALRIATAAALGGVLVWARRAQTGRAVAAIGDVLFALMGLSTVALAALAGGVGAGYHQPLALIVLGYGMMVPTTPLRTARGCAGLVLAYALAMRAVGRDDPPRALLIELVLLATASLMAGFFVVIRRGLQRREAAAAADAHASQEALERRHLELATALAAQDASHRLATSTLDKLRASEAARSQYFAHASHELRTPLTLIMAAIDTLEAQAGQSAEVPSWRAQLQICQRNGMRLLRLVDDILELVSLESRSFTLRREKMSLGDLLRDLAEEVSPYAERRNLQLITDEVGHARGEVMADRTQIERVLLNLLANAIKYSRETGTIRLALAEQPTQVSVSIADTGVGIKAEDLPQIFDHGFGGGMSGGGLKRRAGIGLPLVRRLVEAHHGTISAHSRLGEGTCITFCLPRQPQVAEDLIERRHADVSAPVERRQDRGLGMWDQQLRARPAYRLMQVEQASVSSPATSHPSGAAEGSRVLVVDDNQSVLDLVGSILGGSHQLTIAHDGQEAFALAMKTPPDLIISDLMMPGMNGMALLKAVRGSPVLREVPFVLLTANGQDESRIAATEAGASAYLPKPFYAKELLLVVGRLIRDRQHQAETSARQREMGLRVMADGIAHEILNPIGLVSNAVFILRGLFGEMEALPAGDLAEKQRLATEVESFFQSASEALRRAQASVDQLRSFSRQNVQEPPQRVSVHDAIMRALVAMRGRGAIRHRLDGAPVVIMPLGQLEQIVLNLLLNAVEAGGEACPVQITTSVDLAAHSLLLRVQDEGPGMDAEVLAKIFEPYFTTKEKGTGLGLALCQKMVFDLGGQLQAHSVVGQGTTMTLRLPLAPSELAALPPRAVAPTGPLPRR